MARKATPKATEVALGTQFDVPSIIQVLDAKLNSMKHITESKYRTSGVLDGIGDIKKEVKIENLIKAYASIIAREEVYNRAAIELGITTYQTFEANGSTSEDWKRDIKLRIDIINQKETADKLAEYKDKMSKFLSAQDQKNMLMAEMTSFLNSTGL
jgi:hypothetical protein